MCELFDYLLNKGEQKGKQEGLKEGLEEGEARGKMVERSYILEKLKELEKQGYSLSEALKVLN